MLRVLSFAFVILLGSLPAAADQIIVFAASSLKSALDPVVAAWSAETGNVAAVSYGSSSALAKQIEQGAPADVFISAAANWMDVLDKEGLLKAGTRFDLWGNYLSIIAHDPMEIPFALDQSTDLAGLIGSEKLAMAFVDSVPAGQYGKEALINLGLWTSVEAQVVQTADVRAAVTLVASGEAAYGVVFTTDAIGAKSAGLAIEVARFPENSHAPIIYPGAVVLTASSASAQSLLDFLKGSPSDQIFSSQGFVILKR